MLHQSLIFHFLSCEMPSKIKNFKKQLAEARTSRVFVAGGGFGDVYSYKLSDSRLVAVKEPRIRGRPGSDTFNEVRLVFSLK